MSAQKYDVSSKADTKKTPSDHQHPGDPHLRNYNSAMKVNKGSEPSGTITSGGANPEMSMPILPTGKVVASNDAYARLLDAELPRETPPTCGLSLAEFFCCAGGIGLGFRSSGFRLAFANDISKHAAASYARNLGHEPLVRDIREVGLNDYGDLVGKVDVVTGGFPCVTFSMAGRRMGVTDDLHGKLYLELCRVINELRPRYFVAENVEGILSANGGNAVKLVLAEFLRLGYRTTYELVNMAEHGVPQTRMRVIFVGVRLDEWRGAFIFPRRTRRMTKDKKAFLGLPIARTLREAIGDLPPPFDGAQQHDRNDAPVSPSYEMTKRIAKASLLLPTIVSEAANVQLRIIAARNPDFSNPMRSIEEPSVTMTSSGGAEVGMNTGELRRMTVRECARIQSFPDWYRFEGGQGEAYRQIGNAVPPLYTKRLAQALREYDARPKESKQ